MDETSVGVARPGVLRPHSHLFSRSLAAAVALTTPVFGVIYWLTARSNGWVTALAVHLLVICVAALVAVRFSGTNIRLGPDGVSVRGFFGRITRIRHDGVESVLLFDLYEGPTLETLPRLFVVSTDGRVLLRMRGHVWSRDDMVRVAEELDVPLTLAAEAMTVAELRRSRPQLRVLHRIPRMPGMRLQE